MKVFNIIKGKINQKHLQSVFNVNEDVNLMAGNVTQNKNGIMISVIVNVKETRKHHLCKEDYTWNPSVYACKYDRDCDISEYLKEDTCMKSLVDDIVDDIVVKCDEFEDRVKTASINPSDKTNYWLTAVALLAIAC